jgi:hypothetical protein
LSTTLLTGKTGISLHLKWPLISQLHDRFLKENNWFFPVADQTPRPYLTQSLPAQFKNWTCYFTKRYVTHYVTRWSIGKPKYIGESISACM